MGTMIEIPIFYGEDPEAWVSWIEAFVAADGLTDFETRQLAYGFIGGEAHTWYRDEVSRCPFYSWGELKFRLLKRFSKRSEAEKAKLELQHRLRQLDRLNEWLERRYPEKSSVEKQHEEVTMAPESESEPNEVLCHGEGTLKIVQPVQEPIPLVTKPEVKYEIHCSVTDTTTNAEMRKESAEGPLASMEKLRWKAEPVEMRADMRRKKKRWKCTLKIRESLCSVEGKRKEANAYQVFDRMPLKRKEVTEKSKKMTKKGTKPSNQNVSARRHYRRLKCRRLCLIPVLNKRFHLSFMKRKKKLGLVEHDVLYMTLYLRGKRVKMKTKRGRLTKSKGWNHKAKEDKSETQRLQKKSVFILGRKRVTERRKRVSCVLVKTLQKFNRHWLLSFIKKKKGRKKLVCDKKSMKRFHTRDFAKLAGEVIVLKQSAKGKRFEFKHNHKKQKKWIRKLSSACLWSDQWLQLYVLVKLSRQWLLATDKFGLHKRCGYENINSKGDSWIQWRVLETANGKLIAVKRRKRGKLKFKIRVCGSLVSFLITIRTKLRFKWRERMSKHKTNNKGRVKDTFSSSKMRLMSKISWESRMVKSLCFVAWCISGNGTMGFASGRRMYLHSDEVPRKTWLLKFTQQEKKKKKYHGSLRFSFERVKETTMWLVKILMKKHGFELQYLVWEPGIEAGRQAGSDTGRKHFKSSEGVAYRGKNSFSVYLITGFDKWKEESKALSNRGLEGGFSGFISKLMTDLDTFKGARMIKLMGQQFLTVEVIAPGLLHGTYVMFHSPRPPEWLGIPCHDFKLWKFGSSVDGTFCFSFTTNLRLFLTAVAGLCCSKVPVYEQEEIEEKRCQFSSFNLEDKVDFKGGGIVT